MIYANNYGVTFLTLNPIHNPLQFNTLHTYRDLELLPTAKPVITPPTPKTVIMDIPGADGELDYTEALTGSVNYSNRRGTFAYVYVGNRRNWDAKYHEILDLLHGYRMGFMLDEDPGGYYTGRLTVGEPSFVNGRFYITFEADLDPYWRSNQTSTDPWIWDTFRFATDVIRDTYEDIIITNDNIESNPVVVYLYGSRMPVNPDVYVSEKLCAEPLMCKFPIGTFPDVEWVSRAIRPGDNQNADFILRYETKMIYLYKYGSATGSSEAGKVSVKYDVGLL